MPGFDGTGPRGFGPMTGRGMGYCAVTVGKAGIAYRNRNLFGGYGADYSGISPEGELDLLKKEFAVLQSELKQIEERINVLQTNS
jgi:hypothetical protein